jgi:hypothetical protein
MRILDDEIVQYPVHKRFLPAVVQAHAAAMAEEATIPAIATPLATDTTEQRGKPPPIDWTQPDNMKKLRQGLAKQKLRPGLKVQMGVALMDVTAEATLANPPRRVTFDEVYKRAGFTDDASARSSLGAFTKVIRREFNVSFEDAIWPTQPNWGDRGEAHYSMSPKIARAWLDSAD